MVILAASPGDLDAATAASSLDAVSAACVARSAASAAAHSAADACRPRTSSAASETFRNPGTAAARSSSMAAVSRRVTRRAGMVFWCVAVATASVPPAVIITAVIANAGKKTGHSPVGSNSSSPLADTFALADPSAFSSADVYTPSLAATASTSTEMPPSSPQSAGVSSSSGRVAWSTNSASPATAGSAKMGTTALASRCATERVYSASWPGSRGPKTGGG